MPLSDMPIWLYAFIRYADRAARQEGTSRGSRARDRFRQIAGPGTHLRELFAHAGFDMRIAGTGTARRSECKVARDASRMIERGLRVRIVLAARRIMDSKDSESRLIHQYFDA